MPVKPYAKPELSPSGWLAETLTGTVWSNGEGRLSEARGPDMDMEGCWACMGAVAEAARLGATVGKGREGGGAVVVSRKDAKEGRGEEERGLLNRCGDERRGECAVVTDEWMV